MPQKNDIIRKKPLTRKQANVMCVIRTGGLLVQQYGGKPGRYRLLDSDHNPLMVIQARTYRALKNSDRIIRSETIWIANPKKRNSKI